MRTRRTIVGLVILVLLTSLFSPRLDILFDLIMLRIVTKYWGFIRQWADFLGNLFALLVGILFVYYIIPHSSEILAFLSGLGFNKAFSLLIGSLVVLVWMKRRHPGFLGAYQAMTGVYGCYAQLLDAYTKNSPVSLTLSFWVNLGAFVYLTVDGVNATIENLQDTSLPAPYRTWADLTKLGGKRPDDRPLG